MGRAWTVLVLMALGVTLAASGGILSLAVRGKPAEYAIVIPSNAPPCVALAATELRDCLRRQTGVELPITNHSVPRAIVFDVRTDSFTPQDEAFQLKAVPPHLLIVSGGGRGALYGAYELLERFGGCAWYSLRFAHEPRLASFDVPDSLDETQRPAFVLRAQNWNRQGGEKQPLFLVRNKLNSESLPEELGGPACRFDPVLRKCHTFEELLPVAKWFAAHPEYFSEVGGQRVRFHTQLCLTNPDVLRLCTERVLARLAESYPKGIRHYGISPNDWGNFCRCATCEALDSREKSRAATLIAFVNKIAEVVEARYPDAIIQTLAYSYTRRPPLTITPRRNVQVCLCTIECDFFRSLDQSRSRENRETRAAFSGWSRGGLPLSVWDYAVDFAGYLHPWPDYGARQRNIAFFRERGVTELFEHGNGGGANDVWNNIRYWLIAKWMWNPDLALEPLLDKCLTDHFGPAAAEMRAYLNTLETAPRDTKRFPMGCFERIYSPGISDVALKQAAAHLGRAEEILKALPVSAEGVRDGEVFRQNLALARLPVDFTRAMRGWGRPFASRDASRVDKASWIEERACAQRVVAVLDSPGGLRFADDVAANTNFTHRLRTFAAAEQPPVPRRRIILEETQLTGDYPATEFRYVCDPEAADGRAVLLPGKREESRAWLSFSSLILDPDGVYIPRVRVKVVPQNGGGEADLAFRAGVYNHLHRRASAFLGPEAIKTQGYTWYSLGAITPKPGDMLWVSLPTYDDPSRLPDVYIDRLELLLLGKETK